MLRVAGLAGGIVLATITPGAVLLLMQQWAPVAMIAAGTAGAAAATAVIAYRKAMDNGRRITAMEKHIPKRSTDTPIGRRLAGVNAMPGAIIPGEAAGEIAGSPRGEVGP